MSRVGLFELACSGLCLLAFGKFFLTYVVELAWLSMTKKGRGSERERDENRGGFIPGL